MRVPQTLAGTLHGNELHGVRRGDYSYQEAPSLTVICNAELRAHASRQPSGDADIEK